MFNLCVSRNKSPSRERLQPTLFLSVHAANMVEEGCEHLPLKTAVARARQVLLVTMLLEFNSRGTDQEVSHVSDEAQSKRSVSTSKSLSDSMTDLAAMNLEHVATCWALTRSSATCAPITTRKGPRDVFRGSTV